MAESQHPARTDQSASTGPKPSSRISSVFLLVIESMILRAPLRRAALGAATARACADDFRAATIRARRVHEHIAEGLLQAFRVGVPRRGDVRFAFAAAIVADHVDD